MACSSKCPRSGKELFEVRLHIEQTVVGQQGANTQIH